VDGQTGWLIRPGDLEGLEERVGLLAADAGMRERMGEAGRALVREGFPVERMVDALQALYLRLWEEKRGRGGMHEVS
jgi:glycosyltransferase involved in cell wall biosynthesis